MGATIAVILGFVGCAIVSATVLLFAYAIWADVKIMRIEMSKLIEELSKGKNKIE